MKKKQKLNREWTRMNAKLVTRRVRRMWPRSAMGFGHADLPCIDVCRVSGF
jgi:hypothetical protein